MTVLVVEDDPDQLMLRALLLEQSGFEVIRASCTAEALQLAGDRKPFCAIVDFRMPTEDCGSQLIQALKEMDSNIRVIVLTGGDLDRIRKLPQARLVDKFLAKPVSSKHLTSVIKILQ